MGEGGGGGIWKPYTRYWDELSYGLILIKFVFFFLIRDLWFDLFQSLDGF